MLLGSVAASGLVSAAPGAASPAGDFLAKVAVKLGITEEKLTTAFKDARVEQLDEALAAGKITQAQRDAMKTRIEAGDGAGFPDHRGPGGDKQQRPAMVKFEEAIASAIGITPADLKTAMKAGKTPVQVAQEKGIDQATLKTKVLANVKIELSAQVTAGKLTQAQADKAYDMLSSHIDDMLTKAPRIGAPGQRGPGDAGARRPGVRGERGNNGPTGSGSAAGSGSTGTTSTSGYSIGSRAF